MADHDSNDIQEEEEEEVKVEVAAVRKMRRFSFNILIELTRKGRKYGRLPRVTSKHLYKPLRHRARRQFRSRGIHGDGSAQGDLNRGIHLGGLQLTTSTDLSGPSPNKQEEVVESDTPILPKLGNVVR